MEEHLVSKRPRGRTFGFKTPSWKNSWFQNACVGEELNSKRPRGRTVGFKTPAWENSWFQNSLVEQQLAALVVLRRAGAHNRFVMHARSGISYLSCNAHVKGGITDLLCMPGDV